MPRKPKDDDLLAMLSRGQNANQFAAKAVEAFHRAFGSHEGPYNVDSVAYLATAMETYFYVRDQMEGVPRFPIREALLDYVLTLVPHDGLILEFGVNAGHSCNFMAERLPNRMIYGFDSFEGLPEAWAALQAGHFAQAKLPTVRKNVELVVGWFDRTLPTFVADHPGPVSFLHIDCDLYASTQTVLTQLRDRIRSGTVILFDEYFNYPEWRKHEFKAFREFIDYTNLKYKYIGLVPNYEQAAVVIL